MTRLEVAGVSKSFGANQALRNVSVSITPGEIHGLVGENGSGKSTLVKILSGYHAPDPGGEVRVDGERLSLPVRPSEMRRRQLAVVHQDLGLVDSCSVVENLRIGRFGARRITRAIRWADERQHAVRALAELGQRIEPTARVGALSAAERASIAIARALQDHAPGKGLIMFDESSRALPRETLDHFHQLIHGVAARGGSVLLVSHRLDEVLSVADRVTVLRDGKVVGDGLATRELTESRLICLMLGRELDQQRPARARGGTGATETAAAVTGLQGRLVREARLRVNNGEIVGITGLPGSGFEEIPYLVTGARPALRGALSVAGRTFDLARTSTSALVAAGVVLVPERRAHGLAPSMTVRENVTIPRVRSRGSRGWIGERWQRDEVDRVIRHLGVRPAEPTLPVGHLSGGNQQKVLLGRWLAAQPRLLVLHEPTQGVDVGARRDLFGAILRVADAGCGVLVAGMDAGELATLCDRVLIVRDGVVAAELAGEVTLERIVTAVYRRQAKQAA